MALGFYFNQTECTGCRTCQIACKDRNNNEVGVNFRKVSTYETGKFPTPGLYHYTRSCNHCENPACVEGCPVGAMQKAEDGTVFVDQSLCVGCQACAENCPYGAPQFLSNRGVMGKCDGCKSIRENGGNPACVDACPMRCLSFGEMDKIGDGDTVNELPILPSASKTNPNLKIKPRKAALEKDYVEQQV